VTRLTHDKAVAQCVEEIAFLWLRREQLVSEPHPTLADFVASDWRLQARLDELVAAGDAGWRACQRELAWEEPGEVFPATFVALEEGDPRQRLRHVLDYALRNYELSRPLIAALAWKPLTQVLDLLEDFLTADVPPLRRVGLAAAIAHRRVPESALATAVEHDDLLLRGRALRGVGELGARSLLPQVAAHVTGGPNSCALEAAWTCALRGGLPAALSLLTQAARQPGAAAQRAIAVVTRVGAVSEMTELLHGLAELAPCRRTAILGAGSLGNPALVDWLLTQIDQSDTARVAGEALAMITGISLDDPPFRLPQGEHEAQSGLLGDDGECLDFGPDDHLPWPNRRAVADWWLRHRAALSPGRRYLLGRPIDPAWCQHVVACGHQRQRAAAALELAIQRPDEPLFETRAPGWRQRAWIDGPWA
jgi:uncharacterized protein (TIGR02270 family)